MLQLKRLETALHQHEVRTDRDKLMELLHPQLLEIGYSGKTYRVEDIIAQLLSEPSPAYEVWSQDFEYNQIAADIIQIVYRSARLDGNGNLSRHAIRTSIWVNESGNWQIKFHQATPSVAFTKSNA